MDVVHGTHRGSSENLGVASRGWVTVSEHAVLKVVGVREPVALDHDSMQIITMLDFIASLGAKKTHVASFQPIPRFSCARLIRVPKLWIAQIRLVLECLQMRILPNERRIALCVSSNNHQAHSREQDNHGAVDTEVNVESVEISRRPDGLEQLGTDRITSRPSNDYLSA